MSNYEDEALLFYQGKPNEIPDYYEAYHCSVCLDLKRLPVCLCSKVKEFKAIDKAERERIHLRKTRETDMKLNRLVASRLRSLNISSF